jgi:hypothetical protein
VSRIIRVETKGGCSTTTVEVDTDPTSYVPPPEGWTRHVCTMAGNDACIIEDLLVRGFPEHGDPTMMFALDPEVNRQDLSHEEDIAGIIERCRPHAITVEVGEVFDETDCVRMDRPFRVFRGWRMSGEGCPWASSENEYSLFTEEDGQVVCSVCLQVPKPKRP